MPRHPASLVNATDVEGNPLTAILVTAPATARWR